MSSDITLRLEKGTDLSYEEADENFTHIRRLYRFTEDSVTSGGSGNSYTITSTTEPQTSFVSNMMFGFIASFSNTTTNPTMSIDGLDPKIMKRGGGQTIDSSEMVENDFYIIRYNNSDDSFWILESPEVKDLITELEAFESSTSDELGDIRTTQGVSSGATNLGTFSGAVIPNSSSVKVALQALETFSEGNEDNISTNTDAISALQALNISASAGNTGRITIPYSSTNAIMVQWGQNSVGSNDIFFSAFPEAFTDFFQIYSSFATTSDVDQSCGAIGTNTTYTLRNSSGNPQPVAWIAVGRVAL